MKCFKSRIKKIVFKKRRKDIFSRVACL